MGSGGNHNFTGNYFPESLVSILTKILDLESGPHGHFCLHHLLVPSYRKLTTVPGTCASDLTRLATNSTTLNTRTSEHAGRHRPARAVASYDDDVTDDDVISAVRNDDLQLSRTHRQSTYVCNVLTKKPS